jgi:type I restriction enzyme, S subunit
MGEIPSGWTVRSLDEIATFLNGLALQKFPPVLDTPSLPVIKIAQLRAGHTLGADRAAANIKPEYVVRDGDILFSWSGSLECEIWAGGPGALNQHLFKVFPASVPKWYAFLSVRRHLASFRQIAADKATTMGHIQRNHLRSAKMAVPPRPILKCFGAVIEPMIEAHWKRKLELHTLAALRDSLLPKLFSGDLRLTDAMQVVKRSA